MPHARNIAAALLDKIQSGERTLDQLLESAGPQIQSLNRADRALLHAIIYGVLRWQARLDWVIDHLTSRPGKKIDPLVRTILRIGVFQLHYLDRIPISAAVNTSVELTKKNRRKWASGFVNSVLRRAADAEKNIPWPYRHADPLAYIATCYSFPRWLVARWIDHWGMEGTQALCRAINTIPKINIRTNTLYISRQELMDKIRTEAKGLGFTIHSPEGIFFSSLVRPIAEWEAFKNGWFQVQGEAAQFIAHLLSPHPGHLIWDACAGLGTKTAHVAQLMKNKGRILATDISEKKLSHLNAEMQRLGISIVESLQLDLTQASSEWRAGKYDRILIDAPCTGLGVLQKNPDGKWRGDPKGIENNSCRQLTLLENCAPYLKSGGFMVYTVCSIEPEENERVIERFLQKHPEFVIDHPKLNRVSKSKDFLTAEGFMKTIPHQHKMDGFFSAVLKKL